MAGKHDGFAESSVGGNNTPVYPGTRLDRAYTEGRQHDIQGGVTEDNPHPAGTPEAETWALGFFFGGTLSFQRQTCWVA